MAANGKDFGQLVPFGDPVRHPSPSLPQLCRRFQHAAAHISLQPALARAWRGRGATENPRRLGMVCQHPDAARRSRGTAPGTAPTTTTVTVPFAPRSAPSRRSISCPSATSGTKPRRSQRRCSRRRPQPAGCPSVWAPGPRCVRSRTTPTAATRSPSRLMCDANCGAHAPRAGVCGRAAGGAQEDGLLPRAGPD